MKRLSAHRLVYLDRLPEGTGQLTDGKLWSVNARDLDQQAKEAENRALGAHLGADTANARATDRFINQNPNNPNATPPELTPAQVEGAGIQRKTQESINDVIANHAGEGPGRSSVRGIRKKTLKRVKEAGKGMQQKFQDEGNEAFATLWKHGIKEEKSIMKGKSNHRKRDSYHVLSAMEEQLLAVGQDRPSHIRDSEKDKKKEKRARNAEKVDQKALSALRERKDYALQRLGIIDQRFQEYLNEPGKNKLDYGQLMEVFEVILRDPKRFLKQGIKDKTLKADITGLKKSWWNRLIVALDDPMGDKTFTYNNRITTRFLKKIFGKDITRTEIVDWLLSHESRDDSGVQFPASFKQQLTEVSQGFDHVTRHVNNDELRVFERANTFHRQAELELGSNGRGSATFILDIFRQGDVRATQTEVPSEAQLVQGILPIYNNSRSWCPDNLQNQNPELKENLLYLIQDIAGEPATEWDPITTLPNRRDGRTDADRRREAIEKLNRLDPNALNQLYTWLIHAHQNQVSVGSGDQQRMVDIDREQNPHYDHLRATTEQVSTFVQRFAPARFTHMVTQVCAGDPAYQAEWNHMLGFANEIRRLYDEHGPEADNNAGLKKALDDNVFIDPVVRIHLTQAWEQLAPVYRDIGSKITEWENWDITGTPPLTPPAGLRIPEIDGFDPDAGTYEHNDQTYNLLRAQDLADEGIERTTLCEEDINERIIRRIMLGLPQPPAPEGDGSETSQDTEIPPQGVMGQLNRAYRDMHNGHWANLKSMIDAQTKGQSMALEFQEVGDQVEFNILSPSTILRNAEVLENTESTTLFRAKLNRQTVFVYLDKDDSLIKQDPRIKGDSLYQRKPELLKTAGKMYIINEDQLPADRPRTINSVRPHMMNGRVGICHGAATLRMMKRNKVWQLSPPTS